MTDVTSNLRNENSLKARNLNTGIPKPNIVRIEVLDGNARLRYLGGLQKLGDTAVRNKIYDKLVKREDRIFFGFIKNGGKQDLTFGTKWDDLPGSGNLLGGIKALVGGATELAEGISNIGQSLTGISATATGSSSLKKYSKSTLEDFNVECIWYLPEQFSLCTRSLQVLSKMVYPRQVPEGELEKVLPALISELARNVEDAKTGEDNLVVSAGKTAFSNILHALSTCTHAAIEAFNSFNELFGRNLTFDPLPVRVSVGQYMDIEPLVINKLSIDLSKETFINSSGRHVPITCSVNISFEFWMRPAPNLQFASLLGRELFGETDKEKVTIDKKQTSNVNKEKLLENDKSIDVSGNAINQNNPFFRNFNGFA